MSWRGIIKEIAPTGGEIDYVNMVARMQWCSETEPNASCQFSPYDSCASHFFQQATVRGKISIAQVNPEARP